MTGCEKLMFGMSVLLRQAAEEGKEYRRQERGAQGDRREERERNDRKRRTEGGRRMETTRQEKERVRGY